MNQYDIIDDIHAHADILQALLKKLGYQQQNGYYQHPAQKAVFLGDFIDSDQQNRRVIELVKPMVEQQAAYAILGNHEYNAICFHTYGADGKTPLRAHSQKTFSNINSFYENIILTPKNRKRSLTGLKPCPYFWS
jgi:predicted MPP superfamily phosphohydrolase